MFLFVIFVVDVAAGLWVLFDFVVIIEFSYFILFKDCFYFNYYLFIGNLEMKFIKKNIIVWKESIWNEYCPKDSWETIGDSCSVLVLQKWLWIALFSTFKFLNVVVLLSSKILVMVLLMGAIWWKFWYHFHRKCKKLWKNQLLLNQCS